MTATHYVLGPVIGRIGGAEVEKIPVSGGEGALHVVEVPPGETWLVVVSGYAISGTNRSMRLRIGDIDGASSSSEGEWALAMEATGTTTIEVVGDRRPSFTGHVYTVPLN